MLSEIGRKSLLQDISTGIDFSYRDWNNPNILIYRFGSMFPQQLPSIGIQFLPTRERKFVSQNDLIDIHPKNPEFFIYGYCEIEAIRIIVACKDNVTVSGNVIHGRDFVDHWARKIAWRVRREWPTILESYGAAIEVGLPFEIKDMSRFFQATKRLVYEVSLYIRTPHIWDYIPDTEEYGWESGVFVEDALVCMDDDADKGGEKETGQYDTVTEVDT